MSEKERRIEGLWELLTTGFQEGMILLTGALFALWAIGGEAGTSLLMSRFGPVLLIYFLVGTLLQLLKQLSRLDFKWFRGITFFYIGDLLLLPFIIIIRIIPGDLRYVILADFAVLLAMRFMNYFYMKRVAKQLNSGRKGWTLVIDLKEKPKNKEEFFAILEEHCMKNDIALEYLERDIPAVVKMDGQLHRVELNYYYTYGGPVYTMDIIRI